MSNCSNDSCFKTYTDPLAIAAENNNNYTIRYNTGNRGVPRGGGWGRDAPSIFGNFVFFARRVMYISEKF